MKVLVRRERHLRDDRYRVDCPNCGSTLEYEDVDTYRSVVGNEIVGCPVCFCRIVHSYSNIDIER